MPAFAQCHVLDSLLMNRETVIWVFIAVTSPLLLIQALLEYSAPSFILDNYGQNVAYIWSRVLSLVYILWCLFFAFIILMGSYLALEQRLNKNKTHLNINSENEIVLSEDQKQTLIRRAVLDISLVFNSEHTGFESFSDDDRMLKFAVISADGSDAESELEKYLAKHLGKKIVIDLGKSEGTRRWDRIVTLS